MWTFITVPVCCSRQANNEKRSLCEKRIRIFKLKHIFQLNLERFQPLSARRRSNHRVLMSDIIDCCSQQMKINFCNDFLTLIPLLCVFKPAAPHPALYHPRQLSFSSELYSVHLPPPTPFLCEAFAHQC